jgi:hypothetical protein
MREVWEVRTNKKIVCNIIFKKSYLNLRETATKSKRSLQYALKKLSHQIGGTLFFFVNPE